ncbi:MAG: regulator of chromosome condensation, partial [Acidimicrobiaceae bacterium]
DGDGWPDARCCNADAAGALVCGDDCEDMRPTVHPTQAEVCDMLDNDCDGAIDEGTGATFYVDSDGDTYGTGDPVSTCGGGVGYAARGGDCDDTLPAVNPGADEICDALDNDCNGNADEIVTASPECPGIHCASIADAGTWGRRSGPNVGGYLVVNEITESSVTCAAGQLKIRLDCAATGANLAGTSCYPASAFVMRTREGALLRFDGVWAGSDRVDFGAASVTRL